MISAMAALLALAIILPLLGNLAIFAHAASQADLRSQISTLKGEAQAASTKKQELQTQLQNLENDKAQALQRKELLNQQLAAMDEEIASTEKQIVTYEALIAAQEEALVEAQQKEADAYERFCARARAMEEAGNISYWSVLFHASSFSDLLDRIAMVGEIVNYDNAVVEELADARADVETKLAELNATKAELDAQKASLDVQRAEQAEKVAEAQALFDQLKQEASATEALVQAEEAEEEKIAAQIAAKEQELEQLIKEEEERRRKEEEERKRREEEARRAAEAANQGNTSSISGSSSRFASSGKSTTSSGSGWIYPLPGGCTNVTSEFGYRKHPLTGRPNMHTGLDIAAPGGTAIKAAQGGVVTVSGYAPSSYGEYVVISHGNGRTTLYAHMQRGSRQVREGSTVSAGQVIGRVGMTGSASGNHLHLEYKVNGVRQNPRSMFPNVGFY